MNDYIVAGKDQLSKAALAENALKTASALASTGVREGDTVAVMLRNCMPYLEIILAARTLGCYYCPINWHFTPDEVAYLLEDSGAGVLITDSVFFERVREKIPAKVRVFLIDADQSELGYVLWRDSHGVFNGPEVAPRGHMAYTSGTTGKPKGVVRYPFPADELQARKATSEALVAQAYGLRPGVRALLSAPIYHSAPSLYTQMALLKASTFVVTERFDPHEILQLIQQHRIETLYMVPIMYVRLLRLSVAERNTYDVSSLKFVVSTGSPCPIEVKRAMIEWFGPIIYETYASSEAGLVTLIDSSEALERPGSVGRPLPGGTVRILDETGATAEPGTVGRIFVRQQAYADFTYRGNPGARAEIEQQGLIGLGDLGFVDEQGYLYVCDRESDMVISGGVNIYPAEIEQHIFQYPGVTDCVVFGIPDQEYGEQLLALIQTADERPLDQDALRQWLKPRLAGYKIPRDIRVHPNLPRDDSGKIMKRKLRSEYWAGQKTKV